MSRKISWYYHRERKGLLRFLTNDEICFSYSLSKEFPRRKFVSIVLDNLVGDLDDIQASLTQIRQRVKPECRVIIIYYNHLWEPILKLASIVGLRTRHYEQNWLDEIDIINFLQLAGFEYISTHRQTLIPIYVPILSDWVNKFVASLPLLNRLCLNIAVVARPASTPLPQLDVSVIVPARNEAGNIRRLVRELPKFGRRLELIFVEGHSRDDTWAKICAEVERAKVGKKIVIRAFQQKGLGKADAVRLGFDKAKGKLLMILDADLSVSPKDMFKFYEAYRTGKGEFINGSRLIYPMEQQAMRMLNKFSNKVFGMIFSWILKQHFKDTLCGTKVISRENYCKIVKLRRQWGDFDPFGDFELIFGAVKLNLKVVELPVRYRQRTYGTTNISRFKHGWLLLKMTFNAYRRFCLGI